jgi:hypothetical protein
MTTQANTQDQNLPAQKSNNAKGKAKKPMSKAMEKMDKFRDQLHESQKKIMADDYSCVVYLYRDRLDRPCAIGYRGRAMKRAFTYYYTSDQRRDESIREWMDSVIESKNNRTPIEKRKLFVGDVLYSSWGYEQTNVDYYLVIELIGKASVMIVEIGQHRTYEGQDCGRCTPDTSKIIGEPMKKRVNGFRVKIDNCASASKVNTVDGKYESTYWSSYY